MPPDEREALRDGRVGRNDDRFGGHEAAGGVRGVQQEHADVIRFLGLHEVEQCLATLVGELRDEVCRVIRLHLVEHIGRAVVAEVAEDVDLLALGHLFEHVGETFVAQLFRHLEHALPREVEEGVREVGR